MDKKVHTKNLNKYVRQRNDVTTILSFSYEFSFHQSLLGKESGALKLIDDPSQNLKAFSA